MEQFALFIRQVKNRIRDFLPEEYQSAVVTAQSTPRNNDRMGVSLIIQKEGQTFPFAFDLGQYYQMRLNGDTEEMVLSQIADECVKQNQKEQDLMDFEKIKNRLWMQLLAKESNQERLKSCPYKEIEGTDLVATFHLHTNNEKDSTEGILVVNGLLEQWGQDVDSLYREALQNMQHQMPVQIKNLNDFLLSGEANQKPEQVSCNPVELYVMTNAKGEYGAATLLYPEVLQTLAENSNADLFILPSSIHEVLVMKADGGMEAKELQYMVMEINRQEVRPEEVLSDQVYRYDRESQSISLATTREETEELLRGYFPLEMQRHLGEQELLDMEPEQ